VKHSDIKRKVDRKLLRQDFAADQSINHMIAQHRCLPIAVWANQKYHGHLILARSFHPKFSSNSKMSLVKSMGMTKLLL
jgi:hypothetical protein